MTQQPFTRPGAIDLSGLKRPQQQAGAAGAAQAGATSSAAAGSAYAVDVDEQSFQSLLEASMTAPVVLVFYATSQAPESAQLARDVATVAGEYDGRFLAGPVPEVRGFWLATGCNGTGFSLSPAIGQMLGEWITGGAVSIDLSSLAPARFAGLQLDDARLTARGIWQYTHYYTLDAEPAWE